MAQQVQVKLVDDVDGSEAAETVTFALDGRTYEIDLSRDRAARLRATLEPYVAASRRGSASAPVVERSAPAQSGEDTTAIRTWAREQGFAVSERGRIPGRVRRAYEQRGNGQLPPAEQAAASAEVAEPAEAAESAEAPSGRSLPPVANPFAVPSAG